MLNDKMTSKTKIEKANKLRSVFGIGGLVFIFIAVFFVNEQTVSELEQSSLVGGRGVASVHPSGTFSRDTSWQKNLATRIAEMPELPSGKSARPPNGIEKFLFGELKGYYLMELKNDKVSEMLLKQKDAEDLPQYAGEEVSFLEKNKDLWWISFSKLAIKERSHQRSIVSLIDASQQVVGQASFSWDVSGRLLSLKIEKQ